LLLTRDVKLAEAAAAQGCLLWAERLDDQLAEVIAKLGLAPPEDGWLSRCLDCDTPVQRAARRDVRDRVPPGALALARRLLGLSRGREGLLERRRL